MRRSVVGMELDVGALASAIDSELRAGGNAQRAEQEQAYLKSVLRHYGASVPTIRAVAKAIARQYPAMTHRQLVQLVEVLWAEPVHERRMACVELLDLYCDRLGPGISSLRRCTGTSQPPLSGELGTVVEPVEPRSAPLSSEPVEQ